MVLKYFSKEYLRNDTPSRKDGVEFETEKKIRNHMARMMQSAGKDLKLPAWTIASATIDAQRFYAVKSLRSNNRLLVVAAALFLAAKSHDCPRALQDVVTVCWNHWNKNKPAHEAARLHDPKFCEELKELVVTAERSILYARGFDMEVLHPYQELSRLFKKENIWKLTPEQLAKHPKLEHLKQSSWNFLNDSLGSTLYIEHTPQDIAKSALYLGFVLLKLPLPVPPNKTFAEHFAIKQSVLDDIVQQFLARYQNCSTILPEHTAGQGAGEPHQTAAAELAGAAETAPVSSAPATHGKAEGKVPAVRVKKEEPESPEEGELPVGQETPVLLPHANGNGICHKRKADSVMELASSKVPKVELMC